MIHDETPGSYLVTHVSPYTAMNHELIHDNLNLLKRFVGIHLLPSFQVIFFLRESAFGFYMDYKHRPAPSPYQLVCLVQRAGYSHSFYLTKKLVRKSKKLSYIIYNLYTKAYILKLKNQSELDDRSLSARKLNSNSQTDY